MMIIEPAAKPTDLLEPMSDHVETPPRADDVGTASPGALNPVLMRTVTEVIYASGVPRTPVYRVIMRHCLEQHERQRAWLEPAEIADHVRRVYDRDYTDDHCGRDLEQLKEWGSLAWEVDRRPARNLGEAYNKRSVYQISRLGAYWETRVREIETSGGPRGSLQPAVIDELWLHLETLRATLDSRREAPRPFTREFLEVGVVRPWTNALGRFKELTESANAYHSDLKVAERADPGSPESFLRYQGLVIENLTNFIDRLASYADRIGRRLHDWQYTGVPGLLADLLVEYEERFQGDPTRTEAAGGGGADLRTRTGMQYQGLRGWFQRDGGCAILRRTTVMAINDISERGRRLTERSVGGMSRKADLQRLAIAFIACPSLDEAHALSAHTLGLTAARHLAGNAQVHLLTDIGRVWDQPAQTYPLMAHRRGPRAARELAPIEDVSAAQEALLAVDEAQTAAEVALWDTLFGDGDEVTVEDLTVANPAARDRLLEAVDACLLSSSGQYLANDGSLLTLALREPTAGGDAEFPAAGLGSVTSIDGTWTMPRYRLVRSQPDADAEGTP